MKLHIRHAPLSDKPWWVVGEGVNFTCRCSRQYDALHVARAAQRDWFHDAQIIDHTKGLSSEYH